MKKTPAFSPMTAIGGFALVAWPAEYGLSGVQTLVINPDKSWRRVDLE
jgi:Protein of unknown function (DUF2950)